MNFLGSPCEAQGLTLCTKDLNFKGDLPFDFSALFSRRPDCPSRTFLVQEQPLNLPPRLVNLLDRVRGSRVTSGVGERENTKKRPLSWEPAPGSGAAMVPSEHLWT